MSDLEILDLMPRGKESSFCLPGAKRFSRFLRSKINDGLEAFGPYDAQALHIGGPLSNRREILLNDLVIGNYFIERHEEGATVDSCTRFYRGRIPGLINGLVVKSNSEMLELIKNGSTIVSVEDLRPVDSFVLSYSTMRGFNYNNKEDNGLRRYDMHSQIPFP